MKRIKDVQMRRNEAKPEQGLLEHIYGSKPCLARAEKGPEKHLPPPPAALWHESCSSGSRKAFRKSRGTTNPDPPQQAAAVVKKIALSHAFLSLLVSLSFGFSLESLFLPLPCGHGVGQGASTPAYNPRFSPNRLPEAAGAACGGLGGRPQTVRHRLKAPRVVILW